MGKDGPVRGNLAALTARRTKKTEAPPPPAVEKMPAVEVEEVKEPEKKPMMHATARQYEEPPPRPREQSTEPVVEVAPARAIKAKRREQEFIRHTYYSTLDAVKNVKYYAVIDERPQSEIVREAVDEWLAKRDAQG